MSPLHVVLPTAIALTPMIGNKIRPTKVSLMFHCSTTASMAETKNSAQIATKTVMKNSLRYED